jgi:Flp pilus assembly pilin Flp
MPMNLLRRWLTEEDGQDLIEYALLCSFVGFTMAGSIAWVRTALGNTYSTWDTNYQTDALVEVPDPK